METGDASGLAPALGSGLSLAGPIRPRSEGLVTGAGAAPSSP